MPTTPITARRLAEILAALPADQRDLPVILDGCDVGGCVSVTYKRDEHGGFIWLECKLDQP